MRLNRLSLALIFLLLAWACKINSEEADALTAIEVTPEALRLTIGETQQIKVKVVPPEINMDKVSVEWKSDNTNVALVSSSGLVTAMAAGMAEITTGVSVNSSQIVKKIPVTVKCKNVPPPPRPDSSPMLVLHEQVLNNKATYPDIQFDYTTAWYAPKGLDVIGRNSLVRLNRFYALGERFVRYKVQFSSDAIATFQSHTGDFKVFVDVPKKTLSIATIPVTLKKVEFLKPEREYLVEISHLYQKAKVRIADVLTGQAEELDVVNDGPGGVGVGAIQTGFSVGMQWDYYCFGLQEGSSMLVSQISVQAFQCGFTLLLYGDSITQPEGYFPANDFLKSWTQLIMGRVKGKAASSGRGGGTIDDLLERIKNELPYVKAKYVMVTIGTNGGNTEGNLCELVEYIQAQGSIPILNNIPANEHGTQNEVNALIEKVRKKYGINGCRFDLPTSLNNDGKEVDKSTMWHEDYTNINDWGHYYHHPNVKGSQLMFLQTLIDTPEIYE